MAVRPALTCWRFSCGELPEHLKTAGLGALADLGFLGVDKLENPDDLVIVTGFKATRAREFTPGQKQANRVLAAGRAPSNTASRT